MFDVIPEFSGDTALEAVQRFFFDHAHDLAEAARRLGGAAAEARVIACGVRLETVPRIDDAIRRELIALHGLLALESVGDPDLIETGLFTDIDPASPEVKQICLLTDLLEDLVDMIDFARAAAPVAGIRAA